MAQWPPTPAGRQRVAAYLCRDLAINPYTDVLPNFCDAAPHQLRLVNGMYAIGALQIPEQLLSAGAAVGPGGRLESQQLAHLALHCMLWHTPGNGINWIRGAYIASPSPFTATMWSHVAYAHTWPWPVALAAKCARPDLVSWCRAAYYDWVVRARSPAAIERALAAMLACTWPAEAPSVRLAHLTGWMTAMQTPVVVAAADTAPECTDLTVNAAVGLCVAQRDKALLSMLVLRGEHAPCFDGWPPVQAARKAAPGAFATSKRGDVWLDEVRLNAQSDMPVV